MSSSSPGMEVDSLGDTPACESPADKTADYLFKRGGPRSSRTASTGIGSSMSDDEAEALREAVPVKPKEVLDDEEVSPAWAELTCTSCCRRDISEEPVGSLPLPPAERPDSPLGSCACGIGSWAASSLRSAKANETKRTKRAQATP